MHVAWQTHQAELMREKHCHRVAGQGSRVYFSAAHGKAYWQQDNMRHSVQCQLAQALHIWYYPNMAPTGEIWPYLMYA